MFEINCVIMCDFTKYPLSHSAIQYDKMNFPLHVPKRIRPALDMINLV